MFWLAASIAGVVFLGWFGNYTSEKYRLLYGELPKPVQKPPVLRQEEEEILGNYSGYGDCFSTVVSTVSCIAMPIRAVSRNYRR